jgi:Fe-S-cluster containining protein
MLSKGSNVEGLDRLWAKIGGERPADPISSDLIFQDGLEDFHFDCALCPTSCCEKHLGIHLTLKDVALLKDQGLDNKIVDTFDPPEKFREFQSRPTPENIPKLPGLLHLNDCCVGLDQEARCALYPYRPMVCRTFPLVLEVERVKDRIFYKFSTSPRCPFHLKTAGFHAAKEISPYLSGFIKSAFDHQFESHRTIILVAYQPDELAALGLAKYLGKK